MIFRLEINDTTINPRLQTRTILVQYGSKKDAKKCKNLVCFVEQYDLVSWT